MDDAGSPDRLRSAGGRVGVSYRPEGVDDAEAFGEPAPFVSPLSAEDLADLTWYLECYLLAPMSAANIRHLPEPLRRAAIDIRGASCSAAPEFVGRVRKLLEEQDGLRAETLAA